MPKKYHINVTPEPLGFEYISKFKITRGDNCINCGKCSKVCIYEAHKRRKNDPRKMDDPKTSVCRNCFRCIQECSQGALVKSLDMEFKETGGDYWKPDILLSLWKQAGDGKVPVSGAGYRGPFTGAGFDSMWTDMSEIVRPTRDGIHGREYISTGVDLGRKLSHLEFKSNGELASEIPKTIDLPLPIMFDVTAYCLDENVKSSIASAAKKINTFAIFNAGEIKENQKFKKYLSNIIPLLEYENSGENIELIKNSKIIEINYTHNLSENFREIKDKIKDLSNAIISVRVPAEKDALQNVLRLAKDGAEVIHITADYRGRELNSKNPKFLKEIISEIHNKLVEEKIRDEVTIIASGGIAAAEHVPKAAIMGADAVAVDIPLFIALGGRIYENPEKMLVFPEGTKKITVKQGTQRIVNLMGAWHSQLLEVMGAMGIREARRLRGETGRAIFFDEIDKETFGEIFNNQ